MYINKAEAEKTEEININMRCIEIIMPKIATSPANRLTLT